MPTKSWPLAAALLISPLALSQDEPPNFLLIIADDVTYNDLPLYGGPNISTPNIDRLASEGLTFDRAYLSMAMCNPCRTELYTGLYPFRNGSSWNHSAARAGTLSVVDHLGRLGYRVGLAGKKHVLPDESFRFEAVDGITNHREPTPVPEFDTSGIAEFIGRDPDQPFFLVTAFHEAHAPWTVGRPDKFDLDKLTLPDNLADTPRTREQFATYLAEIEVWDWEVGKVLDALDAGGQAGRTVVLLTSEQGSAFPGNKWTNWNTGVHTALVVRWPGRISPGIRTDALVQYADVLPTLVAAAGAEAGDQFDGRSFLPVLRGQAASHREYVYLMHNNVPEGPPYPIRSIVDARWHYIRNLQPEALYFEKHMMGAFRTNWFWETWLAASGPSAQAAINRKAVMLANRFMRRPAEQLYDVAADPYQLRNLIGDLGLADIRERLAAALGLWMQAQGDPGSSLDSEAMWRDAREGQHLPPRSNP